MAESWHLAKGKTKLGAYSREQLKQLARSGQLRPDDNVLPAGSGKWVSASAVEGVFARPQPPAPSPAKRKAAPLPARAVPVRKRSAGKTLVVVGAVLVVCGC